MENATLNYLSRYSLVTTPLDLYKKILALIYAKDMITFNIHNICTYIKDKIYYDDIFRDIIL